MGVFCSFSETIDATCWFTIHPATKRKSGERVHNVFNNTSS